MNCQFPSNNCNLDRREDRKIRIVKGAEAGTQVMLRGTALAPALGLEGGKEGPGIPGREIWIEL